MPDAAALVTALREGRTWQQVAALLKRHGSDHAGSYWQLVEQGEIKRPNWRAVNALRAAQDPPLPPLTPGIEYALESGARYAIQVDDDPDAALLVDLQGRAPASVRIRTNGAPVTEIERRPQSHISALTSTESARDRGGIAIERGLWLRLRELKIRQNWTWDQMLERAHELMRREYGEG